jgi:hypothetical protein
MALKGKRTSGEASPGERVAGRSRDARYRKALPVTTAPQGAALSGAATAVHVASSGEAESLCADEPLVKTGGDPPSGRPHGALRFAGASA